MHYSPNVMPFFRNDFFALDKAKLVQQDFYDEFGHLIAPWDYGNELRANSVLAVIATFRPCNIRVNPKDKSRGFRRVCTFFLDLMGLNTNDLQHYELRGYGLRILRRGDSRPTDQTAPIVPQEYLERANTRTLNTFVGFSRVKRGKKN